MAPEKETNTSNEQQQQHTNDAPTAATTAVVLLSNEKETLYAFDPANFRQPDFNVDQFLTSARIQISLDLLRTDLDLYLKDLKNQLVELINRDYADFVNLSTNLVGVDKHIEMLCKPLKQIQEEILKRRDSIQQLITHLESLLAQRSTIREKKAVLQLFLNIANSIKKVEMLLESETSSDNIINAAMIERVAGEFNQLQFYISNVQGLPFYKTVSSRIDRIRNILQNSLHSSFITSVRENNLDQLTQCLRTYAIIDKTQQAEELYRTNVVAPFLNRVVTETQLNSRGPTYRPLVLASIYEQIIKFVQIDCSTIIAITKNMRGTGYNIITNAIWPEIVNVIQKNIPSIFSPGVPDVFHQIYKVTMTFVADCEKLTNSTKTLQSLRSHKSYTEFMNKWQARQAPIYFQIRFSEISVAVEDCLANKIEFPLPEIVLSSITTEDPVILDQSICIIRSIKRCWSDDIYLYGLAHRFWRLTLQLLARYDTWIEDSFPGLKHQQEEEERPSTPPLASGSSSRMASPAKAELAASASAAAITPTSATATSQPGELSADQYAILYYDFQALSKWTREMFHSIIAKKLPGALDPKELLDSLNISLNSIDSRLTLVSNKLIDHLSRKGIDVLSPIRSIPAQYRMTNKEAPTKASFFVPNILKPLSSFVESVKTLLDPNLVVKWSISVVISITSKYVNLTNELLNTVMKIEHSLKRLKKNKRRTTSAEDASDASNVVTDEDKIRLQLYLDVKQYGKEITQLSVPLPEIPVYQELYDLVKPIVDKGSAPGTGGSIEEE